MPEDKDNVQEMPTSGSFPAHRDLRQTLLNTGWQDPGETQKPSSRRNNNNEGGRPHEPLQGEQDMDQIQVPDQLLEKVKRAAAAGGTPIIAIDYDKPVHIDLAMTAAKAAVVTLVAVGGMLVFHYVTKPASVEDQIL